MLAIEDNEKVLKSATLTAPQTYQARVDFYLISIARKFQRL
ncbi:hypothetical protein SLEP1_g34254 [Rubroshorea leprosula]|uniref:Uncharacterized protein n=1 Tax=Rubroshorea leprosula TaxID=152421 RepID=A0AAV5KJ92_9ROSI|nr:hypothetical protein SLEP1_g34254 [Rubroshorea leprosula]